MTPVSIEHKAWNFAAPKIIESEHCVEQWRFPRSRKKRIRRKWSKDSKNWRPRRGAIFLKDGTMIVHPETYKKIVAKFRKRLNDHVDRTVLAGVSGQ